MAEAFAVAGIRNHDPQGSVHHEATLKVRVNQPHAQALAYVPRLRSPILRVPATSGPVYDGERIRSRYREATAELRDGHGCRTQ